MKTKHFFSLIIAFFLCGVSLFSQNKEPMKEFDYKLAWKNVQEFENKGLPESALKAVNEIYTAAKNENNAPQLVKAIIHQLKYMDYKEEGAFKKNLNNLENEVKAASFPVKPLLHSMLAEIYWQYYQNNRYRFNQRTETVNFKNDDLETWSLEKIADATIKHYQASLEDANKSKLILNDVYQPVMHEGDAKGKALRPTLFDFLAHRAVDFFMNSEPDLVKPAYAFKINAPEYLSSASDFIKLKISTRDTFAYKYYALKIFQELLQFHLNDKSPDALVDADLKRLQFVKQHLTLSNKEDLYLKALEELEKRFASFPVSGLATYNIAQVWVEKGNQYRPLQSDEHKWEIKKAYQICADIIKRYPDSDGAILAFNLQQQIQVKDISATAEKVNIPGQPFRALVSYKNFDQLYWRIIKVTKTEIAAERRKWERDYNVNREEKFIQYFAAKQPLKLGKVSLPNDSDFQKHSAEIKLDAVPPSDYMVLFSNQPEFKTAGNGMAYAFTTISNISYIHRNCDDGSTDFYVLNRESGESIAGAKAQLLFPVYNSGSSQYETAKGDTFVTNADGYLKIPHQNFKFKKRDYNAFETEITWQKDKISTSDIDSYNNYYRGQFHQNLRGGPYTEEHTTFFLDRAIYRPGQTIYFKGILVSTDGKNPKIKPARNLVITLYDVNSQQVAQQQVKTNEYGTFSGTFTAPTTGLMGQMIIRSDDNWDSQVAFSVEEYKRPKFEVKFEPEKGSFKLNETIKVTGKAGAYSGANIDGASVKYRVVRQANFPWWWWCWYGYYPSSPEMEITNGTAQTDANGKFEIAFSAIPDESVDKASSPTFSYSVSADVTDINGETHSASASVSVGYKSLLVGVNMGDLDQSNPETHTKSFGIRTTNLSDEFEPASGEIKIWKLKNPDKAYRDRLWERPDKFVLGMDEFRKNFPNDQYREENNFYKWDKEKEVFTFHFDSSKEKNFRINNLKAWNQGKYILEITSKDKYGEDVKEVAYFLVSNSKGKELAFPKVFDTQNLKIKCEPGEKATMNLGSSERLRVLYEVEQDGKIIDKQWKELKDEQEFIEIPIKEEYRGNIAVHLAAVLNNRLYTNTSVITVPFTNKQLDIEFQTFRDKLLPGQQEQWKLKITGINAEKVMAEMVATLYDASLDAFKFHSWYANFYNAMYSRLEWNSTNGFVTDQFRIFNSQWTRDRLKYYNAPNYNSLNWFGYYYNEYMFFSEDALEEVAVVGYGTQKKESRAMMKSADVASAPAPEIFEVNRAFLKVELNKPEDKIKQPDAPKQDFGDVKIRKNFNETAFFYPHLQTDVNGEIIINFTVPEALTRWKMLGFAHTQDLKSGIALNELVTQKDLMVVPNQPRFFRENDKMIFSVKVTSLVDTSLDGQARLEFFDALTMKPIDERMKNKNVLQNFTLKAKQSTNLEWSIEIPEGIQAIAYRVVAKANNFSDGEEMTLPVVTNRMLVTETMPLPIRGNQSKDFKLEKLVNNTSTTLRNQRLTLEFTSNPAWYAIQALPYLMEYPYECTEQTFSRFYANSIASRIANSNPKIKRVFDTWSTIQPDALLSNLEKNQELKSALLEETPWVLNAKDESQRKRNVALLFDLNRMANEQARALKKISEAQSGNGGFSWFPGMPDDRYITQHIVAGLGHLDVMGVKSVREEDKTWQMTQQAIRYLDVKIQQDYEYLKAQAKKGYLKLEENHLDYSDIHYLYARSYFKDIAISENCKEAFNYYIGQAKKYWLKQSIYTEGMIALALNRYDEKIVPQNILKSLSERALHSEEMGMYWKSEGGYYWYQAPIETQALMIEVYDEVANDLKAVEDLKVWLLKQKQSQDWKTTKATSEACYALLRRGTDVLANDKLAEVSVGGQLIDPAKREDTKVEAGTGYFKVAWTAGEITSKMGNIHVSKKDDGVAWGAIYWQYFEQLDKINPAETPLKLTKKLFLQQNTERGPVITPIIDTTSLKVGDLAKVRIEIRVDRQMEYVHLKDMRAAAFEPVETLSTYKYQDGLGYYQSPRDLATNFFIGYLPKGTFVFEYPLRVSQKGDFSNGITTIQCMYAPEFASHSEGVRVKVE